MTWDAPRVAFFRPDDERLDDARSILQTRDAEPVADPMLAIEPTGAVPRTDTDYLILTSKTGVECVATTPVDLSGITTCAIGEATAAAMRAADMPVDIVPEVFTSRGLVERLSEDVDGARVEISRSDHGSPVLIAGLIAAGAYVHETVLYELTRPAASGHSAEQLVAGDIDAVLFTSSLTVEHFLEAAQERDMETAVLEALQSVTVGVIGPPTERTAISSGIDVDIVASEADFESLAEAVLDALSPDGVT